MKNILEVLSNRKRSSILLQELESPEPFFKLNAGNLFNAASFTKLFLALELSNRLNNKTLRNKTILITKDELAEYGQDVLADLFGKQEEILVDHDVLLRLMLKYSCNSSTEILVKDHLPPRIELQKIAVEEWGLKDIQLVDDKGEFDNKITMKTIFDLFKRIFDGNHQEILEALEQNINTFYLFDRFPHKLLASKTAAYKEDSKFSCIGSVGVFESSKTRFFMGAMIASETSDEALTEIREVGKLLVQMI